MTNADQLLALKGESVIDIDPEASVYDALARMAEHNIGALVVSEGGRLVGLISERDYARKVVLQGRSSHQTRVREIMSKNPLRITKDTEVSTCMALMTEHRVRHLPVVENDQVVGIVSIGDALKQLISEQDYTIHQLEDYIRTG